VGLTLTAPEFNWRGIVSVARVYYPAYLATPQQLIESTNMLRSIAEIMRVTPCVSSGAIVVRGFPDEIALAEWLLNGLAVPAAGEGPPLTPYFNPGVNRGVARMFYLKHNPSPQAIQQIATAVSNQANVKRIATHSGAHAIAIRGTPEQVTAAELLVKEMETTP
jgi:hypothetical protein